MKVRLAMPREAATIAALMRDSFDRATLGLTVYGCSGIARYLETRMRLPAALNDCRHLLGFTAERAAGFAEMRLLADAVCLNYIAVARERRGAREGDRLFLRALELASEDRHAAVVLDVFASNSVSLGWYRKLGFESGRETDWWSLPMGFYRGSDGAAGRCQADGLPEAEACERIYGFSRFDLSTPRASYRIGRLAGRWFRTADPRLVDDECAIACLALLDPSRKILGLFPPDFDVGNHRDARRLDRSVRMRCSTDELRARLAKRIGV